MTDFADAKTGRRLPAAAALVATAALALPVAARAAVLSVLQSSPDAVTVLDRSAITTDAASPLRRAWTVTVKRVLTSGGPQQPGYVGTFNEYDCAARRIRWRTFQAFSRFGDLVMKQDNPDQVWNPAPADTEAAEELKAVCDGWGGYSAIAAPSVSSMVLSQMRAWDEAAPLPPLQKTKPAKRGKAHARAKLGARHRR